MIAKKNPRYDLEKKRIVLFQIGLMTAGSFTLAAFTYRSPLIDEDMKRNVAESSIVYEMDEQEKEIPKTVQPIIKQEPQNQNQSSSTDPSINTNSTPTDQITLVNNTKTLIDPTVGVGGLTLNFGDIKDGTIDVEPEPMDIVDFDAEYIGGFTEMMKFIQTNLVYPQDAIELNEQGKVYLSFVVEKDGSVSNVHVERGVCRSIDREAERIIRSMPNWKPGEMNYGKVRSRVRIPINFVLKQN